MSGARSPPAGGCNPGFLFGYVPRTSRMPTFRLIALQREATGPEVEAVSGNRLPVTVPSVGGSGRCKRGCSGPGGRTKNRAWLP